MAKPFESFAQAFSKACREPAAKRRSLVATSEIPPLRLGKSNLKIGNEVTNFWGGFSAKKANS